MPHFDPTITLGSLIEAVGIIISMLIALISVLRKIDKILLKVNEHETSINEIKEEQKILLSNVSFIKGRLSKVK